MARTPTRTRKVLLAITLAMLAVVLAAWPISYRADAKITWTMFSPTGTIDWTWGGTKVFVQRHERWLRIDAGEAELGWLPHEADMINESSFRELPRGGRWNAEFQWYRSPYAVQWNSWSWHERSRWSMTGVILNATPDRSGVHFRLRISLWAIALALGAASFWLWWPFRRSARRRAEGLCLRCGYDRRGLAPAAACPECGASAPASEADAKASPTV